ncbi:MAG: hypothetical protein RIS84_1533 [Pseudomonadota bacterium]
MTILPVIICSETLKISVSLLHYFFWRIELKKLSYLPLLGTLLCSNSQALEIRHINTVFANMGQCTAEFFLDGGPPGDELTDVQITLDLRIGGKKEASLSLEVPSVGGSTANRYQSATDTVEGLCNDDPTAVFILRSATAVINGKRTDLLKTKSVFIGHFKPTPIKFK